MFMSLTLFSSIIWKLLNTRHGRHHRHWILHQPSFQDVMTSLCATFLASLLDMLVPCDSKELLFPSHSNDATPGEVDSKELAMVRASKPVAATSTNKNVVVLDTLPTEVLGIIGNFASVDEMLALGQTSKKQYRAVCKIHRPCSDCEESIFGVQGKPIECKECKNNGDSGIGVAICADCCMLCADCGKNCCDHTFCDHCFDVFCADCCPKDFEMRTCQSCGDKACNKSCTFVCNACDVSFCTACMDRYSCPCCDSPMCHSCNMIRAIVVQAMVGVYEGLDDEDTVHLVAVRRRAADNDEETENDETHVFVGVRRGEQQQAGNNNDDSTVVEQEDDGDDESTALSNNENDDDDGEQNPSI